MSVEENDGRTPRSRIMDSISRRLCARWMVYPRSCCSAKVRTACNSSGDDASASAGREHRDQTIVRLCQVANRSWIRCSRRLAQRRRELMDILPGAPARWYFRIAARSRRRPSAALFSPTRQHTHRIPASSLPASWYQI